MNYLNEKTGLETFSDLPNATGQFNNCEMLLNFPVKGKEL